jgi:hypothetical protein
VKQVKAGAKPGAKAGKGPAKPKSAATKLKAAKAKAAKETKKRAEAKRAALHLNRQKPAPRIRPATIVSQGQ